MHAIDRGKMEERQNPPIAVRNGKTLENPTRLFDVVRKGDSGELVHTRVYRQVRRLGCARPRAPVKRRSFEKARARVTFRYWPRV